MSLASRKLIQATAGATTVDTGDDDFANVVLLLDGDGTSGDANNTFTDSSTNGFTVTENGSVVQGSFSPYGNNWSNYFDNGSNTYRLLFADDASFDFGTGDFTVEAWIYRVGTGATVAFAGYAGIIGGNTSSSGSGADFWSLYVNQTNRTIDWYGDDSTLRTTSNTINDNEWTHVAVSRSSSTLKIFINGVEGYSATVTSSYTIGSNGLSIGRDYNGNAAFNGYISNVRVVKGTGLYTSGFTPSTSPLTAVSGTSLLTCQSNRFIDNSTNNHTATLTGTPKVTPFSPFKDSDARTLTTDGGSAFFSASQTNNQLILADDDKFNPGSSDFTLEAWVHTVGVVGNDYQAIWSKWTAGGQEIFWALTPTYQLQMSLWFGGLYTVTTTKTMNANEWNHVAATRSGGTVTLWINGQSEGTLSVSGSVTNNSNSVYVGNYQISGFYEFNGYISDVRWVKGTALYTSAFTPPTSPLTAITNTETLLSFQDAGIYDRTGINNVDTVSTAQIDTAVTKYGTGSMQFDGSGDYLLCNSSEAFGYGTGDFTLECWIYKNANPSADAGIIEQRPASTNGNYPMIGLNSSGQLFYYVNAAYKISASASTALSNQAWDHVAYVRSGGNLGTLYINGTSVGTWVDTTNYVSTTPLRIGEHAFSAAQFNGFIDDLRITKGVARYTSNFTPPTDALPKF
jgi:hypothetical protein